MRFAADADPGQAVPSVDGWSGLIILVVMVVVMAVLAWRRYRRAEFPLAWRFRTFEPRVWALMIDSSLFALVQCAIACLPLAQMSPLDAVWWSLAPQVVWAFYFVGMHRWCGRTLGKMLCGVRVVSCADGGRLSWRQAIVREIVPMLYGAGISAYVLMLALSGDITAKDIATGQMGNQVVDMLALMLPGLWYMAEIVTLMRRPDQRALHDLMAGTVVERTRLRADEVSPAS